MDILRKRKFYRLGAYFLVLLLLLSGLAGCRTEQQGENVVILYTNDVHCAVDSYIGYAGLAAYKAWMQESTPYVTLVDCGDALQGDIIGTISQGEYLIDIMNQIGYDFAVLGNHEFDYGMEQLQTLLEEAETQYLGCNIRYTGTGLNAVSSLKPYELVSYGDIKVAFVGVSTPESIAQSTPAYFMDESGDLVYDFYGDSGETLYMQVQETVDACREKGADYVVVLAHLGDDEDFAPFRSIDLIAATTGIDVVLDGHSHSVIPCDIVNNKNGEKVLLSSTGTGLMNIGQLVITADGNLTAGLISDFPDVDEETDIFVKEIQSQYETEMNRTIAYTDVQLTTKSESAIRLVRNRETNLGDLCADAYRAVSGADIAFVNGGGIRADIEAGDISYGEIIAVQPYGNTLCVVEATGQEILDALEIASRSTMAELSDGENAVGENGGFLQVSGLKYTIDTSIPSTVEMDNAGMFVSLGENRRVKDVQVLQADESYVPIDPAKTYTLASHNYLLKQGGDGLNLFMDNVLTINEGMLDYQVLITYITDYLGGTIGSDYAQPQGRITVE